MDDFDVHIQAVEMASLDPIVFLCDTLEKKDRDGGHTSSPG